MVVGYGNHVHMKRMYVLFCLVRCCGVGMIRIVGSPEPDEKCNQEGMHGIHFLAG